MSSSLIACCSDQTSQRRHRIRARTFVTTKYLPDIITATQIRQLCPSDGCAHAERNYVLRIVWLVWFKNLWYDLCAYIRKPEHVFV